jgi:hypothetical protein
MTISKRVIELHSHAAQASVQTLRVHSKGLRRLRQNLLATPFHSVCILGRETDCGRRLGVEWFARMGAGCVFVSNGRRDGMHQSVSRMRCMSGWKTGKLTHFVIKRAIHAILFCTEDVCLNFHRSVCCY